MVYSKYSTTLYGQVALFFADIFCSILLLIIIRPLYKFSKERTALYILFSKSCMNCIYQSVSILQIIWTYIPLKLFNYYLMRFFIYPMAQLTLNSSYFHMTFLALNRFHAVFFIFSYNTLWKKRNIKYFISAIWIISVAWTIIQYIIFYFTMFEQKDLGIFRIIATGIFMSTDLPLITSLFISLNCYVAVLAKFFYNYKMQDNATATVDNNTLKERTLVLTICLISITPCPFLIGFYYINDAVFNFARNSIEDETALLTVFYIIYNCIYVLIQSIEEICLLLMSKDFRKLVKSQFVKNTQTSNVTTVYVLQNSQQRRMNQLNSRNDNLVNNLQT